MYGPQSIYSPKPGQATPFTLFSDSFPDASMPSVYRRYGNVGGSGVLITVSSTGLVFGGSATLSDLVIMCPWEVAGVRSLSQFARAKYTADSGIGSAPTRPTLACFASGNTRRFLEAPSEQIYVLTVARDLPVVVMQKWLNGNGTNLIAGIAAAPAINDVLELRVEIVTASEVQVSWHKNGVLQQTATDSSSPYLEGMPGLGGRRGINAAAFAWDDFECGILESA